MRTHETSKAYAMDKELSIPTLPLGPEYASDPIPANAIRLRDAFYRVLEVNVAGPTMVTLKDSERADIRSHTESDLKRFVGEDYPAEDLEYFSQGREANVFVRNCLAAGDLVAHVRDPETGEILQLMRTGWEDIEFIPGELGWLDSDHVHPDDPLYPGPPDVMVRGKARPVFFLRDEFENWFQKTFVGTTAKRGGRKPGSGSWEHADEPLVKEMHRLFVSGSAKSPEDAARLVEHRSAGSGTLASKRTRLAKRYRKQFPSEHN
jgi:hypothetical protein